MNKIRDEQKGIILISIILCVMFVFGLYFIFGLKTDTVKEVVKEEGLIRLLLVVEGEENTELFSTVLIYDPLTKKAASFNVPSNTGATYKSLGRTDGLDTVYNQKGMEVYKSEVENLLGIIIPFTASIKMKDFIRLSDMLGGMRIFIFNPIDQVSEDGSERWLLPSGSVNLDGDKISTYLRYRVDNEDDVDVLDRYQNVIGAFLTQLHDKSFVIFDGDNFTQFGECITTNLLEKDEYELFKLISEVDAESVIKQTITGSIRVVEGRDLLLPLNNGALVKRAVDQTTSMIQASEGNAAGHIYVLEILNGTTVPRLAYRTGNLYASASYKVISTGNADSDKVRNTEIINYTSNEVAAKNVGDFIRCKNIRNATEEEKQEKQNNPARSNVDFVIILGEDFNGQNVY